MLYSLFVCHAIIIRNNVVILHIGTEWRTYTKSFLTLHPDYLGKVNIYLGNVWPETRGLDELYKQHGQKQVTYKGTFHGEVEIIFPTQNRWWGGTSLERLSLGEAILPWQMPVEFQTGWDNIFKKTRLFFY